MNDFKKLSLKDLILLGVGGFGSGIFILMMKIIKNGGNYALLGLIIASIMSFTMSLVYIEGFSRFKSEITEYEIVKYGLNEKIGKFSKYLVYFFVLFTSLTIIVFITKYTGYFKGNYFKEVGFTILVLCIITFINLSGITVSKNVFNLIAVILILMLGIIILFGFGKINIKKIVNGPKVTWNSFIFITIISLYLFNGFGNLIRLSSEADDKEDVNKGILASIGITIFLNVFMMLIMISIIGFGKITNNPISSIYKYLFNESVGKFVFFLGILILFNAAFVKLLGASRFLHGLGKKDEIIHNDVIKKVDENNVPKNAIIITFIISIFCALLNNEVLLAVMTNFTAIFNLIIVFISFLIIRWRERENKDSQEKHNYIKGNVKNIPILVVIVLIILVYFLIEIVKNKFWIGSKLIR